jgi:UDP-GlcNAc:undecaprenyl-phosphate GlcNAc-1-phosphate transferase
MEFLALAALGSCALCLMLTPLSRVFAFRWGLVDRPDRERKLHKRPIPVAGGLAVFLAFWTSLGVISTTPVAKPLHESGQAGSIFGLFLASVVICVVGVIDDVKNLRGRYKLLLQTFAALIVVQAGTVVRHVHLFGGSLELGIFAVPFTLIWLVAAINSLNLLDGMDGMVGTVGLIAAATLAGLALYSGNLVAGLLAATLAGALLSFLVFNLPPASIFLGDSGSMFVGLVIGTVAIQASLKGPATAALSFPLAVLAVPFFDTSMAIVRRRLTGRSIYATDRGHLHHCLLNHGYSNRGALLLVGGACLATSVAALASMYLERDAYALVATMGVLGGLVVTGNFGSAELALVRSVVLARRRLLTQSRDDGTGYQFDVRLQGSRDWHKLWNRLVECAAEQGLTSVCLAVNAPAYHEDYYAKWQSADHDPDSRQLWYSRLPVRTRQATVGSVTLSGVGSAQSCSATIVELEKVVALYNPLALATEEKADTRPPVRQPIGGDHALLRPQLTGKGKRNRRFH